MNQDELRKIPGVDELLGSVDFPDDLPQPLCKRIVRNTLEAVRESVKNGSSCPAEDELKEEIRQKTDELMTNRIQPVINATGVVLHTNLGRAIYSEDAVEAIRSVLEGYSSLEIDVSSGNRGGRGRFAEILLAQLTGAQEAGVVNNCSGALVLVLKTLAEGRDVIISRGELVQIGGGFRIPEVLEESGANLKEVGTTNRTSVEDYENAIDEETALILRVHRSNFDIVGFSDSPSNEALAELSHRYDLPFVSDLGSGALWETSNAGMVHEHRPGEVLDAGADLVTFSGDKLLGGPQAGLFVGDKSIVKRMKNHPFFRALRCDKTILTALESTLETYANSEESSLPVIERFLEDKQTLRNRAEAVCESLGAPDWCGVEEMDGAVGGGALPRETIPSYGLSISSDDPDSTLRSLRNMPTPIIGRVRDDRVLLNFRTILPEQTDYLTECLAELG
ncbi:MAG: L-seryl-tRNA(Sec) selenium transferase [bacterium]